MSSIEFVQRGQALVERGQYQEAVKVCRLGLLAHPTHLEGRLLLGTCLLALRRYDEVLAEMRVALEIDANSGEALALRGEALLRKGDPHLAAEVLARAQRIDPGSGLIRTLLGQAEREAALATRSGSEDPLGQMTKHYPAHRQDIIAVGDRSGTMEIDPDRDGVEMVDDDIDPVIDPPIDLHELGKRSDVIELESHDLLDEEGHEVDQGWRQAPQAQRRQPENTIPSRELDEPTVHYRKPPSADRRDRSEFGTGAHTVAERPSSRARAGNQAGSQALADSAAAIVDMFEDESGVSKLTSIPDPQPVRTRSRSDDMRTIRAGLNIGRDRDEPPAVLARLSRESSSGRVERAATHESTEHIKRPTRQEVAGKPSRRPGRKRRAWIAYAMTAAVVAAAGVFAGLEIRELRLGKDIQTARRRAEAASATDTLAGLLAARRYHARIVGARPSAANRAALARITARIGFELGNETITVGQSEVTVIDRARQLLAELGEADGADAVAARAYLALATGQIDAAAKLAAELSRRFPQDPDGPYLEGSAALAAGKHGQAEARFRQALRLSQRPAVYIGLGRAQAELNRHREAIEAFKLAAPSQPDHPAVIVATARVMASMPSLLGAPAELDDKLVALREEARARSVSRRQAAWAALALVEVKLARGRRTEALGLTKQLAASRLTDDWDYSRALSRVFKRLGRLREAEAEAERAAKRWPKRPEARILLAEVALEKGEAARALAALEAAGELELPRALAARGRARLATGDLAGATTDLDAALAKRPELLAAQVARAEIDLRIGKPDAAVARMKKIYNEEASPETGIIYATALRQTRKPAEARLVLRKLIAMPNPGRAYLELARLERDSGNFEPARKAYAKAIELAPDTIEARLDAAVLALETGDPDAAIKGIDALERDAPDNGKVLVEAARIHTITGKVKRAIELLDRAAKQAGTPRWKLARERGRALMRTQQAKQATGELGRAIGLRPDDGATYLLLIDAYLTLQDKAAARKSKQDVLRRFRDKPEAQLAIGRLELSARREAEAVAAFEKARAMLARARATPRALAEAYYWIGQTQYYRGKIKAATAALSKATKLDPSHAYAYFFIGLIQSERPGGAAAAVRAMQKTLALDPLGNPDAYFYLGEAAYKAKQWATAKRALKVFLEKTPSSDLAKEARVLLARLR